LILSVIEQLENEDSSVGNNETVSNNNEWVGTVQGSALAALKGVYGMDEQDLDEDESIELFSGVNQSENGYKDVIIMSVVLGLLIVGIGLISRRFQGRKNAVAIPRQGEEESWYVEARGI